jgi:hypothetical protein
MKVVQQLQQVSLHRRQDLLIEDRHESIRAKRAVLAHGEKDCLQFL